MPATRSSVSSHISARLAPLYKECHPSRVLSRGGSAFEENATDSRSPSPHLDSGFRNELPGGLKDDSLKESWLVGVLLGCAGVLALWFFYSRNEILLSGDAVAHINIARRVFDSRTPGLLQLGSVWLPLPHLLAIPFIVNTWLCQTGIVGSLVLVLPFILAGVRLF